MEFYWFVIMAGAMLICLLSFLVGLIKDNLKLAKGALTGLVLCSITYILTIISCLCQ